MQAERVVGYPLSPQQRRIWSEHTMAGRIFAAQVAVWIDGELDRGALTAAVGDVVRHHEILRTRFVRLPGMAVPLQVVDAAGPVEIRSTRIPPQEHAEGSAIDAVWSDLWNEPFDLESGAALRVRLVELSLTRHALFLSLPALCSDTAGLHHLVRKIRRSYLSHADAEADPPFQYADFAAEWNKRATSDPRSPSAASDETRHVPRPALPGEVRPAQDGKFEPHEILLPWPAATSRMLWSFAEERNASLESALLSVWRILLFRLTGGSAIVGQVCRDGRIFQELEGALGCFSWPLPVGGSLDESALFGDVVDDTERALSHLREADVPAAETPGLGPSPSFEFVDFPEDDTCGATAFRPFRAEASLQRFTIQLSCVQADGSATVRLRYDATRFPADGAQRIADAFSTLATSVVSNPRSPVRALNILSEGERTRIVQGFNETERPYDAAVSIVQLFERAAAGRESRVAVVSKRQRLTYLELNQKANRLAAHLRDLGAGPETVVGVCTTRSVHFPLAVLAVLKAGAAWLGLDPSYPAERLSAIARDALPSILLTEADIGVELFHTAPHAVRIDLDREDFLSHSPENLTARESPRSAAYVIYTSGSSGQPKGVVLTRGGLANYVQAMGEAIALDPSDVYLHTASIGFSSSVRQLLLPLTQGATCVFASEEDLRDPVRLFERVQRESVTVVDLVPSLWRAAMDAMALLDEPDRRARMDNSLRLLLSASEPLSPELVRRWRTEFRGDTFLINMYGQTETTGIVSVYRIPADLGAGTETVPLGRPIGNTRIHILGASGEPVPVGVIGEVWVGGPALARGYLNDAASTCEAFLPDRFGKDPEARLYRTGDLGVFRADGTLEYRGRRDSQIKIRGFRIEPGEIEATLGRHPGVKDAIAGLRMDPAGGDRLVAWISRRHGAVAGVADLRGFLKLHVPDYMNPTAFVFVESLPKTATGKVDRRRLPDPDWRRTGREVEHVAPRDELEKALATVWGEVLGVDEIGIHDNFFDSGGHSLAATRVISRIRTVCGVQLPVRVLFECPTVASFAERARERLEGRARDSSVETLVRVSRQRQGMIPLSFAQERLWFLDRLEPGSNVYNVSRTIRLRGPLDAAALREALTALLARHESLRSRIREADAGAFVEILPPTKFALPIVDFGKNSPSDWESKAMRLARQEAAEPFDLASGPFLRAKLFRRDAGHHILQLTMHHIASDGWSAEVFFRELGALYGAFSSGKPSPLTELPIQYGDFAQWQREWLRGEVLERQLSYWRNQLYGAPPLDLPADRPNPATPSSRGSVQNIQLSKELTAALRELSRSEGATLFMTLLTAFQALLSRYTGHEDIAVGTPIANRGRPELEELIGLFVNTLVLRVDLSGDPTFRELLRRVREVALAAYGHQDVPFEKLVEELHPERKLGHNPLFEVMVAFRTATREALALPGLTAELVPVPTNTAKFDLSLDIVEHEVSLSCDLEYSTDLYDDESIRRMLGHLESLLTVVVQDPDARLSRVPLLTDSERHRLFAWNQTEREYPENVPLHRLFERQAERTPRRTAVECGGRRSTYRLVNERANRLARHLRARGVGPDVLVGLCVERSLEMVVGMLGIMKAGGAYLPLDPAYPPDRLRFMMEDSGAKWLLTDQKRLPGIESAAEKTILLGSDSEVAAAESGENLETASTPENLAYVIYTSGSTGKPKGVEITHGSITNYIRSIVDRVGVQPGDRVLQFASLSFDVAAEEIFATLSVGGTVVLRSEEMLETVEAFLRICLKLRLTVLILPTAYWHEVVAVASSKRLSFPKSVRMVIIGGERALPERFGQWKELTSDHVRLFNAYGPTETTVSATIWEASSAAAESDRGAVPIGRPIANLRAYVLDRHLQAVPVGVGGELFIGGLGVARGYRDRPELTARTFLPDPFRGGNARIYRTGDRARFRNDGNLEYLGRVDSQIKLRGFRVEPGEIETALREITGVREAVVRAREDSPGQLRLIAYVVLDPSDAASRDSLDLRARLRQRLPAHMVPSKFVKLEALPVTPNGKIDFDALPDPDDAQLEDAYVAPRNAIEARMARIWSEVLGVERVGVLDNFFDLGGHSLLAIQLLGRIEKELGPRLSLAAIFRSPRIADLAEIFEERRRRARTVTPSLVPIQRKGTHPPFYCVHAETGVVYYRPLARLVGADQPFYGIQSRGLDGRGRPLETVEEMAAHYVAEVRGFQPEGPYYIGGHSFGGKIAFEMARQLAAAGQRTAFLALFDTATSPSRPLSARTSMLDLVRSRARIHVQTLESLGPREKVSYLIQRWETVQSVFSHWFARATDGLFHPLRHAQRMVREANICAAARYVPKYYEGRVTIFRATDRGVQLIDPDLGWRELCREGVEVHEVPGGHSSILLEDVHLQALGAKLRECLRDARKTERLKSISMGRGTAAER